MERVRLNVREWTAVDDSNLFREYEELILDAGDLEFLKPDVNQPQRPLSLTAASANDLQLSKQELAECEEGAGGPVLTAKDLHSLVAAATPSTHASAAASHKRPAPDSPAAAKRARRAVTAYSCRLCGKNLTRPKADTASKAICRHTVDCLSGPLRGAEQRAHDGRATAEDGKLLLACALMVAGCADSLGGDGTATWKCCNDSFSFSVLTARKSGLLVSAADFRPGDTLRAWVDEFLQMRLADFPPSHRVQTIWSGLCCTPQQWSVEGTLAQPSSHRHKPVFKLTFKLQTPNE